jgi:hypothetical protein
VHEADRAERHHHRVLRAFRRALDTTERVGTHAQSSSSSSSSSGSKRARTDVNPLGVITHVDDS